MSISVETYILTQAQRRELAAKRASELLASEFTSTPESLSRDVHGFTTNVLSYVYDIAAQRVFEATEEEQHRHLADTQAHSLLDRHLQVLLYSLATGKPHEEVVPCTDRYDKTVERKNKIFPLRFTVMEIPIDLEVLRLETAGEPVDYSISGLTRDVSSRID